MTKNTATRIQTEMAAMEQAAKEEIDRRYSNRKKIAPVSVKIEPVLLSRIELLAEMSEESRHAWLLRAIKTQVNIEEKRKK